MNAGLILIYSLSPRYFAKTPYIADLKPGGRYVAKDMFEAGGIPLLMKTLLDEGFLHPDCITVTGRSIGENLEKVRWNPEQDVIYSAAHPISKQAVLSACGAIWRRMGRLSKSPG